MPACPILSAGVAGGVPDVTLVNNCLATLRAIINALDADNISNASITVAKLAAGISYIVPLTFQVRGPQDITGMPLMGDYDLYSMEVSNTIIAPVAMTIFEVEAKTSSQLPTPGANRAAIHLDGAIQGATAIWPDAVNAVPVTRAVGLTVAVAAGQRITVRTTGVWVWINLPVTFTAWARVNLL
jgi:hypothetical protein